MVRPILTLWFVILDDRFPGRCSRSPEAYPSGSSRSPEAYQAAVMKAQKEEKVAEGQFTILDSENAALNKALEEAKAVRDKAITMADSLKFE